MNSAELEGIVLAGGLGARLRAAIGERQKVVAKVEGRPFVCRILEQLAGAGVKSAVLCVGYKAEEVMKLLGESCCGVKLRYSLESSPLGTGGALRLALSKPHAPKALVLNGDSFIDADLGAFLEFASGKQAAMLLRQVDDVSRYGAVSLDGDGKVLSFSEKSACAPRPGLINAGVYALSAELAEKRIPEGVPSSLERAFFPELCKEGLLFGMKSEGAFIDIGTPESFSRTPDFFKNQRLAHEKTSS